MIMEYLPGPGLNELLADAHCGGSPFPVDWAAALGCTLCDLLHLLHSQQPPVLLRWLALDNLLVNKGGKVKMVNFGLARQPGFPEREVLYWPAFRTYTW
jgi:serine/threonine-protein kinase